MSPGAQFSRYRQSLERSHSATEADIFRAMSLPATCLQNLQPEQFRYLRHRHSLSSFLASEFMFSPSSCLQPQDYATMSENDCLDHIVSPLSSAALLGEATPSNKTIYDSSNQATIYPRHQLDPLANEQKLSSNHHCKKMFDFVASFPISHEFLDASYNANSSSSNQNTATLSDLARDNEFQSGTDEGDEINAIKSTVSSLNATKQSNINCESACHTSCQQINSCKTALRFSDRQERASLPSSHYTLPNAQYLSATGLGKWSRKEDARLRAAVARNDGKNWRIIAEETGNYRTDVQCLHRWSKVLKPGLVKGPWTPEEDKILATLVLQQVGDSKIRWCDIALHLPGRIGKQCRERWCNHLDSSINKGKWTRAEDDIIFTSQLQWGNKWSAIAKLLPGRTENAVKNRFNSTARLKWMRKNQQYKTKRRDGSGSKNGSQINFFTAARSQNTCSTTEISGAADDRGTYSNSTSSTEPSSLEFSRHSAPLSEDICSRLGCAEMNIKTNESSHEMHTKEGFGLLQSLHDTNSTFVSGSKSTAGNPFCNSNYVSQLSDANFLVTLKKTAIGESDLDHPIAMQSASSATPGIFASNYMPVNHFCSKDDTQFQSVNQSNYIDMYTNQQQSPLEAKVSNYCGSIPVEISDGIAVQRSTAVAQFPNKFSNHRVDTSQSLGEIDDQMRIFLDNVATSLHDEVI